MEVIEFLGFQLYNSTQQIIRPTPDLLYATKCILTAATCPAVALFPPSYHAKQATQRDLMDASQPFKQIIDGVDLALAQRVRTRFEPLARINWLDLAPAHATFEYLASDIISPLLGIFDDYAYNICQATLDLYPLDVTPSSSPVSS